MRIGLIVPVALLAASPLRSQTVVWERLGSGSGASYQGLQTAMYLGDLNGDGFGDLLVRVAYGYTNETFLWFLSGKDGSTLRVRPNVGQGQYYKSFSAAGDVDQDGVADYAVMIDRINAGPLGGDNIVQVCSGRDDSVFWQVEGEWPDFGVSLRGDVDLDGDRVPDLVLTHPGSTPYGRVEAYSSQGRLLWVSQGTSEFYVGWLQRRLDLGRVGDLDGDGRDDVVVSCADPRRLLYGAAVLSGKDGSVLVAGFGESPGDHWGDVNDGCGDVDRDGVLDFGSGQLNFGARGGMRIWSGRTGEPIWTWRSEKPQGAGSHFGEVISSKGLDVDRDGVPDIAGADSLHLQFNPRHYVSGIVPVYSGRDGSRLFLVTAPLADRRIPTLQFGLTTELVPPQGADPFPLLLVMGVDNRGAQCGYQDCGHVYLLRLAPDGVEAFGTACGGTLAQTPQIGLQRKPTSVRVHLSGGEPGGMAVLVLGFSRTSFGPLSLPVSLERLGLTGCQLHVSIDASVLSNVETGRHAGYAGVDLPVPLGVPGGIALHGQWLVLGSGATAPGGVSDALVWYH